MRNVIQIDNGIPFYYYLIAAAVGLLIIYAIVRSAVASGTRDLKNQIKFQSNLKIEEMKKAGYTEQELKKIREVSVDPYSGNAINP